MLLPSVYTLRSYVVKSTGDVGITPVKKKNRLKSLAINLSKQEKEVSKEVSIEVDEMYLHKKMKFIRQWDGISGQVKNGGVLVIQDVKTYSSQPSVSLSHGWTFNRFRMSCC